ncbi:MAG: translation elongation factor Ts [Labilithrix sp.]|nr:translation elongation factor Ts [Labilithrix sp.]
MAAITPALIKELRERTSAGMSDCKNALVEADGDLEKAVEVILKKGIVKAASRAGKVATEGEVATWVSADGKKGVIVEVNCQTDFVARGDDFKGFVQNVLAVAQKLAKGKDLGAETYPGTDKSIDTVRQELVGRIGENIVVRRWDAVECKADNGFVQSYVHMGGKLAVLLDADAPSADARGNADFKAFVENCAMQIAAMSPIVVDKGQLSQTDIDKQREIFQAQLKEEGKPEQAWPKIIEGKVAKWYTEVTLLGQDNVWEPGAGSIDKIRQELGKKLGGEVKVASFVRFGLGEGIDKKVENLADEVAKTIGA